MPHFTLAHRRTALFALLGAGAFAAQIACSDTPPQQNTPSFGGSAVVPTGGTPGASGTPAGGTFSTSGTGFGTAGDTVAGGTGGAETGGTAGSGGGGTGGADAGTANGGTGGTVVVVPPLDCTNMAGQALPIPLTSTWGFPDSGDDSFAEAPINGNCAADAPVGAAGCWSMAWTPVARTFVHWYWHNAQANWTGPGVCVAAGAKAVTLKARADSDVTVTFSAAGVDEIVDLTTAWQDVVIDISGASYNTYHSGGGVNTGLVVVMARDGADTAARTIYFYDVQWVEEASSGGGEGGAGGAG